MRRALPPHDVRIRRHPTHSDVALVIGDREVAWTSLAPTVRRNSDEVRSFVDLYFHYHRGEKK